MEEGRSGQAGHGVGSRDGQWPAQPAEGAARRARPAAQGDWRPLSQVQRVQRRAAAGAAAAQNQRPVKHACKKCVLIYSTNEEMPV